MANQLLDCKGQNCPMPIVNLSKACKDLQSGQTLEIEATDAAFEPDIKAWTEHTGHELVSFEYGDVMRAVIRKV